VHGQPGPKRSGAGESAKKRLLSRSRMSAGLILSASCYECRLITGKAAKSSRAEYGQAPPDGRLPPDDRVVAQATSRSTKSGISSGGAIGLPPNKVGRMRG
jgi:hypothetical protein